MTVKVCAEKQGDHQALQGRPIRRTDRLSNHSGRAYLTYRAKESIFRSHKPGLSRAIFFHSRVDFAYENEKTASGRVQNERLQNAKGTAMNNGQNDVALPVGTRVRLDSHNETGQNPSEYGVVIHCWRDTELQIYDCLIAFFGSEFPDGRPEEKPYILRYASMHLVVVD